MSVTIRPCDVDEIARQGTALFDEHWSEIALNKTLMVLKPDQARYEQMQDNDALFVLGAFDADGSMIGYSVNIITPHLHYADLIVCYNDILFVTASRRQGRLGLQLIRATEKAAKERGARLMLWHAKPDTSLEAMMPRLGYKVQDIVFSTELKGD